MILKTESRKKPNNPFKRLLKRHIILCAFQNLKVQREKEIFWCVQLISDWPNCFFATWISCLISSFPLGHVNTRAIVRKLKSKTCLSIKDKQIIMSCLDKGEKGTNLAQEYSISKQQILDVRKDKDKNLKSTDSMDTSKGLKWILNIHIFNYLDSRLSGLFIEVPTSPGNRDSTVLLFCMIMGLSSVSSA